MTNNQFAITKWTNEQVISEQMKQKKPQINKFAPAVLWPFDLLMRNIILLQAHQHLAQK